RALRPLSLRSARPHGGPAFAPGAGAAPHRARTAVELRLPARHGHPPAGAHAQAPAFGTHRRGAPLPALPGLEPPIRPPTTPPGCQGLGAAMPFIIRRLLFYAVAA